MNDGPPHANLLGQETSPYLLQHRDNPVHWRAWGEAALAEARAANKPILLSVGYAACHWCHVMAHESFEDEGTAALMNAHFVNVKVDREERPDLDSVYQTALALMGEQGGWPLTMFLTPRGEPFYGGTYYPPTARWGRPGFRDVLASIAAAWRDKQDAVRQNVDALLDALRKQGETTAGGEIPLALIDQVAERLAQEVDPVHGGIRGAPKFPQASIFALIWRAWRRTKNEALRQVVTLTLDRMSQGGIYDHLGGGFARYSTDALWLVPHFEKMLYDNAQLVDLLTTVWQETRSPLYAQRVPETIAWLEREMMAEGGCFAATLDADSEGEEGKYYVWSAVEIDRLLGADAELFGAAYDVRPEGNWEERTILNRSKRMLLGDAAHEDRLARCRAVLLAERQKRVPPGRDDKVLADWNGLMIAALAHAGLAFDRADWIALGARVFDGIVAQMTAADGRLRHSFRAGRLQHPATLDDYANMIRAAIALHEATGAPHYLDRAEGWLAILDRHYWDTKDGGYFFSADDAGDLITRTKHAHDNAVPAGNGTLAQALARLHVLTGKPAHRERAEAIVAAFSGGVARNFFPYATLLNAAELLARPLAVVLVGDAATPDFAALRRATQSASLPNLVLQQVASGAALPDGHPAKGKDMIGGRPTAYVCEGPVCSAPMTQPDALAEDLAAR
jgi:hypothetical protein